MKPFMGLDLTENKKNTQRNGEEFLVQKPSTVTLEAFKKTAVDLETDMKKQITPVWVIVTQLILFLLAMLVIAGILGRSSLRPGIKNIILLAPFLAIWWYSRKKEKKQEKGLREAYQKAGSAHREPTLNMLKELDVPDHAILVDVFICSYKYCSRNSGAKELSPKDVALLDMWAFADDRELYLVNSGWKFAFPLAQMTAIHPVNKKINLFVPQKERNLRKDEWETSQVLIETAVYTTVKEYYVLEFIHNGEQWGIYFPNYELEAFESLTGLSA